MDCVAAGIGQLFLSHHLFLHMGQWAAASMTDGQLAVRDRRLRRLPFWRVTRDSASDPLPYSSDRNDGTRRVGLGSSDRNGDIRRVGLGSSNRNAGIRRVGLGSSDRNDCIRRIGLGSSDLNDGIRRIGLGMRP